MLKRVVLSIFAIVAVFSLVAVSSPKASAEVDGVTLHSCYGNNIELVLGSQGPCVKAVQQWLNDIYPSYRIWRDPSWPLLEVDGSYGRQTYLAITAYQRINDITDDGIVGPQTWTTMLWECSVASNYHDPFPSCAYPDNASLDYSLQLPLLI